jgi:hypothetical protein
MGKITWQQQSHSSSQPHLAGAPHSARWRSDSRNPALANFLKLQGALFASSRSRLIYTTVFCKCAIGRHKPRQHRRYQLCWFANRLSGFASKHFSVCKQIPMDGRRKLDGKSHRLVVGKRTEFQLRHRCLPILCTVRARDRGSRLLAPENLAGSSASAGCLDFAERFSARSDSHSHWSRGVTPG